jgi:hypothetical protein
MMGLISHGGDLRRLSISYRGVSYEAAAIPAERNLTGVSFGTVAGAENS